MKAFVDRIENDVAVLLMGEEASVVVNIPLLILPSDVSEGMYLDVVFSIDTESTCKAHEEIQSLLDSMADEP